MDKNQGHSKAEINEEAGQSLSEEEIKQYEFLHLHQRLNKMLDAVDTSAPFIKMLIERELIKYDQQAPILQIKITEKGKKFLVETHSKIEPSRSSSAVPAFVRGASKKEVTKELKKIDDELIYRFLRFHLGVIRRTETPYLRELVAEDYLIDKEGLGYGQAAKLIDKMTDQGILKYDQWGAFPGTGVTQQGREYFEDLKERFEDSE